MSLAPRIEYGQVLFVPSTVDLRIEIENPHRWIDQFVIDRVHNEHRPDDIAGRFILQYFFIRSIR